MNIFLFVIALIFTSCATKNLGHKISSAKNDTFKEETFLRYTGDRFNKDSQKKPLSKEIFDCYQKNYSKAFTSLKKKLGSGKEGAHYWNTYGVCYYLKNDFIKADYFFNLALTSSNNRFLPAFNNLGLSALKRGDKEAALSYFKTINAKSNFLVPKYNLAQIYLQFGNTTLALKELEALKKQNSDDPDINMSLGITYLVAQKPEKAKHYLNPLFKNKKYSSKDIIFYQALLHFEQKEWLKAKEILKREHFTKTIALKRFAKKMLVITNQKLKEREQGMSDS